MDKFELYMIDNLKSVADKVRKEKQNDFLWMQKNVLDKLIEIFINYEGYVNDITVENYFKEKSDLSQETSFDIEIIS